MIEFNYLSALYSARDIALLFKKLGFRQSAQSLLLDKIFLTESNYLRYCYRSNKKQLILDIMYEAHRLYDATLNKEAAEVANDIKSVHGALPATSIFQEDDRKYDYFKMLRFRIRYINSNNLARNRLRYMLSALGCPYKNTVFIDFCKVCLAFYKIKACRDKRECDISMLDFDDMITFYDL